MPSPTLIAIVDFAVAAADHRAALAQLELERPIVTAMPGCLAFRVVTDTADNHTITVLHEWSDRAAFDGYLASDAFARSGAVLRPLMVSPPSSRRFRVELVDAVA